ncbi:MAG: glycosyltransferase family 4 protein [Bacillota bacterium]
MSATVIGIIIAGVLAWILTPLARRFGVRIGAVDMPNERKVHNKHIPRTGGLAIYLGFLAAVLITQSLSRELLGLLVGGTIIIVLGLMDDWKGLHPWVKLLGQISAAVVLISFGVKVTTVTNPLSGILHLGGNSINLSVLSIPATILWITGVTNALNLIDGLDGLAAGTSAIAAVTIAVVSFTGGQSMPAYVALFLAASAIGFLRHNYHPARIFMGDSGSMFLGFNLAALAIMGLSKGATAMSLFVPAVILGIPLLDTLFAILRRFFNRRPIFQADRRHLHHRLLALGMSHRQAVLVFYGISLCLGVTAVLLTVLTTAQGVVILFFLTTVILLAAQRVGVIGSRGREPVVNRGRNGSYPRQYISK